MAQESVVVAGGGEEKERIEEAEEGEIVEESRSTTLSSNPTQPHLLEQSWTFWFDPTPNAKPWGSTISRIHTFETVESFWGVYNNIHHPSKLQPTVDFHCFKETIEPKWEDPICANGGKWTITCTRGKSDTLWLFTLLAMIGEQFVHGDEICGAVVNIRPKHEKISIWTKNAANKDAQLSIGKQWKEFMDYNDSIGFIFHDDAKKHSGARNSYTV